MNKVFSNSIYAFLSSNIRTSLECPIKGAFYQSFLFKDHIFLKAAIVTFFSILYLVGILILDNVDDNTVSIINFISCSGLNYGPQRYVFLEPQNVTLFAKRNFADGI